MGNWFFNRPNDRQREKIIHDVFVRGRFGGASCAKNFGSSELMVMAYCCKLIFRLLRLLETSRPLLRS
jgi:hypothetical protein